MPDLADPVPRNAPASQVDAYATQPHSRTAHPARQRARRAAPDVGPARCPMRLARGEHERTGQLDQFDAGAAAAAIAVWKGLPGATRRRAERLAGLLGEPHPDPMVASAAAAYADARLATGRHLPGGVRRNLVRLAQVSREEPGDLVIRYRKRNRRRTRVIARTFAICLVIATAGYAAGFIVPARFILPTVVIGLAFPLVTASLKDYWVAGPYFPGRAACRLLTSGVRLCQAPGRNSRFIRWSRLTRIAVFERGDGRQTLIVLVLPDQAVPAPPRSRRFLTPEQWIWRNVSPSTLDASKLDHSAEEIIAALTAHADVPVERHLMPAASDALDAAWRA
jgi:hypothetical protein